MLQPSVSFESRSPQPASSGSPYGLFFDDVPPVTDRRVACDLCNGMLSQTKTTQAIKKIFVDVTINKSAIETFRSSMSIFRFCQDVGTFMPNADVAEKYLRPVLSVFEDYLLYGRGIGITLAHEVVDGFPVAIFAMESSLAVERSIQKVSVMFVPPRSICWYDFWSGTRGDQFQCDKNERALNAMLKLSEERQPRMLVLTDEHWVTVVDKIERLDGHHTMRYINLTMDSLSLRSVSPVSAFLNLDFESAQAVDIGFGYTLSTVQQDRSKLDDFFARKQAAQNQALQRPLSAGDVLDVQLTPLPTTCTPPLVIPPPDRLPQQTEDVLRKHSFRSHSDVTKFLGLARSGGTLQFRVSTVVKGPEGGQLSVVLFGKMVHCRGEEEKQECPTDVCLKLFDDSLFPIPDQEYIDYEWTEDFPPEFRGQYLYSAINMMQNEKSSYTRLAKLQGQVLPYAYGFHKFVLPDKRSLYGILMEKVEAKPLHEHIHALRRWSQQGVRKLLLQFRHIERALLYNGVRHVDAHLGQFLLIRHRPPLSHEDEIQEAEDFSLVVIDFADAELRSGRYVETRHGQQVVVSRFKNREHFGMMLAENWSNTEIWDLIDSPELYGERDERER
ncbi:hypothetical protein EIP91_006453 [Steccherinum ochraceum]|uniref:Protein kinase domain-containing protein n=1 Tax=Steccherinum ochraceum TaxID=92696 RepID=A0A4R0RGC9_9APHY|nr:hypothetical protein EIP91_006453 [Steccherinum ochraceum]